MADGEIVAIDWSRGGRMLIGYARVTTLEQNEDLQTDALRNAGCERIYADHSSGAKRPVALS